MLSNSYKIGIEAQISMNSLDMTIGIEVEIRRVKVHYKKGKKS